jgi:hypothetical protein
MFHYTVEKDLYYISSNKIKWKFWAFVWIFCKNRYIWKVEENPELEKKYPWFKYSFWFTKTKIFIISKSWIEKIIKK